MLLYAVRDGRPVVILVCPCCRRSVFVRWPCTFDYCATCGERAEVPVLRARMI